MTTSLDDIMKFVVISDIYFVDMKIGVTAKMDRRYSNTHIEKYRLYLNLDNVKYLYVWCGGFETCFAKFANCKNGPSEFAI